MSRRSRRGTVTMSGGHPIKVAATPPTEPAGSPALPPTLTVPANLTIGMLAGPAKDDPWTAPVAGVYSMATWPPTLIEEKTMTDPIDTAEQDAAQYGPMPTAQGVRGYRDLEPEEVALINGIKQLEEQVAAAWHTVRGLGDKRWTAVARTHLQEGFTALVRSIAQPHDPFDTPTP